MHSFLNKIIILTVIIVLSGFLLFKGYNSSSQVISDNQNYSAPIIKSSIQAPTPVDNSQVQLKPSANELKQNQPSIRLPVEETVAKKPANNNEPVIEQQIIKATITYDNGLRPDTFTLKAGVPVRFEVDPKNDIDGCMSTILIWGLYDELSLIKAGERIIMEFKPEEVGTYYITCAMGVPWGEIKVIF